MARLTTRLTLLAAACLAAAQVGAAPAPACGAWPDWESFRDQYIEAGRVVDPAAPQRYTTSEGQSYALFFALVANDRASFDRVLRWTEQNLAGGDLGARLPGWQWGQRPDQSWGVTDTNAASDSDVWIAYALLEAARLWQHQPYADKARLLAERIAREETAEVKGLGRVLLPGPQGFVPAPGAARLNPSYLPLQLLRRIDASYPRSAWHAVVQSSLEVLLRSAPLGYAPDWVRANADGSFGPDQQTKAAGSYNAIRVYLWTGMLDKDDPARTLLMQQFQPMVSRTATAGLPPESIDTRSGTASGDGSPGFSAAVLPLLVSARETGAAQRQRARIAAAAPLARKDNYYDQVLTLFGTGWDAARFQFRRDGSLQVAWKCAGK
jgi:endo-1,4-beta-D-glucanase Y